MIAKTSFIFAAFAVAAQLASAQTPPACLLAAVNTNQNPADVNAICKKSSEMGDKLNDMCGDNLDSAQKAFTSICKNAGVAVTLSASSSASASATGKNSSASWTPGQLVHEYTTTYFDSSCSCTTTATRTGTAYVGGSNSTITGSGNGTSQATPTGTSGSGSGSGSSGSSGSGSGSSSRSSSGTASAGPAQQTGAASHYQLAGFSLGAIAVAGLAVAL
ncbi:hypothetical protein B9Z65_8912 [Elsinoe australis]|uniref:Uncharacterized protein n=1 Tax=Elsinoe australis TaxID=40998 RepID=A0A2P7YF58_9PEZI|nr:hypothetical protein B9Z65_8912 [Elsinoe australis]